MLVRPSNSAGYLSDTNTTKLDFFCILINLSLSTIGTQFTTLLKTNSVGLPVSRRNFTFIVDRERNPFFHHTFTVCNRNQADGIVEAVVKLLPIQPTDPREMEIRMRLADLFIND